MVRIIQEDNQSRQAPQPKPQELEYRHNLVLNVMGLVVAEVPQRVRELLEDYSIELSRDYPEEELADLLILAIGECDIDFNRDLASLILDRTLSSSYDQYDFKQLADQAANILSSVGSNQDANAQNQGGILGGLTNTLGQIGSILNQGIQSQSAGEQARKGITAYQWQQAQKQSAEDQKKNNKMLFFLLTALGIGILSFMAYLKRQAQPNIKTS